MTDEQAARLAALQARRAPATAGAATAPPAPAGRAGRSHPAARARSFVLGAAITGTAVLASNMWASAAATNPAAPDAPAAVTSIAPSAAPPEQIVVRIIHRPGAQAASIRQPAPATAAVATPAPATTAAPASPPPAKSKPVTRSRASG